MLRVTVDLVPFGIESRKRTIATAKIWNDATGTPARGNYQFTLSQNGRPDRIWKAGSLKNFPRKRMGIWWLLFLVLLKVLGADRPGQDTLAKNPVHLPEISGHKPTQSGE